MIAHAALDLGYPWWWNFLPIALSHVILSAANRHLHFQLMDAPDPDTARGVPFTWRGIGVPGNGETFETPAAAARPA